MGTFALPNGIITSQCADDWRYACSSRPWSRFVPPPEPFKDDYTTEKERGGMADVSSSIKVL
jgi:hypothetical protein